MTTHSAVPERIEDEHTDPQPAPTAPSSPSFASQLVERLWRVGLVMLPVWVLAMVLLQALARAGH